MYFEHIKFKYEFRDYQKRVLDSLQDKLKDHKIHIVAAPGSGKTVLGLEIIRTLDRKCLILVPSVSIREQWCERFLQLFVAPEEIPYWSGQISTNLENPGILTCVTYQALFSESREEDFETLMHKYAAMDYGCICLDECHHLKKEWWKVLERMLPALGNPVILSLTATPPYDADRTEWARYQSLCGDIDCEIQTPEMVQKSCLCPYQDYVLLSVPRPEEAEFCRQQFMDMEKNCRELLSSEPLFDMMRDYDALLHPTERAELFVREPEFLKALLSYIRYYGLESAAFYAEEAKPGRGYLPPWDDTLLHAAEKEKLPPLQGQLLEKFLEVILKEEAVHFHAELLEKFRGELIKRRILVNNRISLRRKEEELEKLSRNSMAKMDSIRKIVSEESVSLGDELQMVILTDYIGSEEISRIGSKEEFTGLNCVSIFENLRRMEHLNNLDAYMKSYISYKEQLAGTHLGVICGSFAILPETVKEFAGLNGRKLGSTGYRYYGIPDAERKHAVAQVTQILENGGIRVLIGTAALLGEGWDAPGVNTVVIASTVSSYVQSNQMRGRGLRMDGKHPDKTANIWHLVTLQAGGEKGNYRANEEYRNLCRRFDTILGLTLDGSGICSGIGRMELPGMQASLPGGLNEERTFTEEFLTAYETRILEYARQRQKVRENWKSLMVTQTDFANVRDMAELKKKKTFWKLRPDGRFSRRQIKHLAQGLCRNMIRYQLIESGSHVRLSFRETDKIRIYLEDASIKDSKLFLYYFRQLTGEIVSPRYLLVKGFGPWKQYLAVPEYCRSREMADSFRRDAGFAGGGLLYTRNRQGMEALLDIRVRLLGTDRETAGLVQRLL